MRKKKFFQQEITLGFSHHSRFDGFSGALIKNDKTIFLGNQIGMI
jgi:hypothetical protein